MPECTNPLWPCAMTGAAACLAGFEGMTVVIHGSSGCYYYPTTLLHAPLHGTFILEHEIIFGSEDRLNEVIGGLSGQGKRIAVITTCVPAILGEDIRSMLEKHDVILIDSPGFSGDVEAGYKNALSILEPRVDSRIRGVNIDGICLFDPFSAGNVQEVLRLLAMARIPVGTVFSHDRLDNVQHASPYTIGTNEDFGSGIGEYCGGMLGFRAIEATFKRLSEVFGDMDTDKVFLEIEQQEERMVRACDKFLLRFDPPSVVIFSGFSYALHVAETLERYLDADICCIGSRNAPGVSKYPVEQVTGLDGVRSMIGQYNPDLVMGSSFERSVCDARSFMGITPPLRGTVRLAPTPFAGINGTLSLVEQLLNTCMDKKSGWP
jgi:nitrogenase molybdenum-iron protein alpha/beta subunit